MQLQVECGLPGLTQPCSLCQELFEIKEGRVILCDDQGGKYGEVCPQCIGQGIHWLNHQFERLVQQVSRSHLMKPKHSPILEDLREEIRTVSSEHRHDLSQVGSKSLHSTPF